MSIDGLSLSFLVNELHNKLNGGRIEKIFQPDLNSLLIWVRQAGADFPLAISVNPSCPKIHLTENIPENPATPPNFCMLLRKHLEDGRIAKITQYGLDRIVVISVDVRLAGGLIATKELIIELMGKHSNIIFVQVEEELDENPHKNKGAKKIIDAIKRVGVNVSRYRQVLPGREYFYPPGQEKINLFKTPSGVFLDFIFKHSNSAGDTGKKKPLAKELISSAMGIGPIAAQEIIWRAGFSSDIEIDRLDASDREAVRQAIDSIISPLKDGQVSPLVMLEPEQPNFECGGQTPARYKALAVSAFPLGHMPTDHLIKTFDSMNNALDFFSQNCAQGSPTLPERDILAKLISAELLKLNRKKAAIKEDFAAAENGDYFRKCADILLSNIHNIKPESSSALLPDIYQDFHNDEETKDIMITIELEPRISAVANAQVYYAKYNKSKRALENLSRQLLLCHEEIEYLESVELALEQAGNSQEVSDIRRELVAAKYLKEKGKRRPSSLKDCSKPLEAQTSDGFLLLIGKNNRQNDLVTFKQSNPEDIWFHTKDIPGSHVILKTNKEKIPETSLLEAARIAAYFSKARSSANVPVDYTLRRFVRKPAGAMPGFVRYERQKTVFVTPSEEDVMKFVKK